MFKKIAPLFILLALIVSISANRRAAAATHPAPGFQYVSMSKNGSVGGVTFKDEDVLAYDLASQTWDIVFDGSDVGVTTDVNAIAFDTDDNLLLSFNQELVIPGLGLIDDSDVVKFEHTSLGPHTAGRFSLLIDGSLVGLETKSEDIDGLVVGPDNRFIISTTGKFRVADQQNNSITGRDEDVLFFDAGGFGSASSGFFTMIIDNSKHLLDSNGDEDVWSLDAPNGYVIMTMKGAYEGTDYYGQTFSGDGNHVLACAPFAGVPSNWDCIFQQEWNGTAAGLPANNSIDGMTSYNNY